MRYSTRAWSVKSIGAQTSSSRARRPSCKQAPALSGNSFIFSRIVGGVDGTRTRGLRRDRPASTTAQRSRPRKIGVGCPARWSSDADRGRVFRNALQVLARGGTSGGDRPRTASTSWPQFEGSNRGRATSGTCSCGARRREVRTAEPPARDVTPSLKKFRVYFTNEAIGS
jgi:hypothetical protein